MNTTLIKYIVIFFIINFAALGIGSLATGAAVSGEWYTSINKAPWTPPGWAFGAAWTTIMVFFSVFMGFAYNEVADKKKLVALYTAQWILNVSWTPVFFMLEQVIPGLIIIGALSVLVGYFLVHYRAVLKVKVLLMLPYFVWLLIATSLNAYILFNN
ncbi:tryptophan-rich sensory protein [Glaciecola punicea ACAM 611]|jgi:benzodiazapine receptor|uniref:Tryptophan-rich sensory protein n=1 Tax=Glaciecola punicea ACAM 611 TaxID=1121923 RepID=H5TCC0_9ALTE|nr:TspO/MBR family protein [Glaciecola punicea]OFA31945.1 TspO protein [Glaciecola punicea]GAB55947.1 tryptophan-rich sensory protein [Glaciecola punicea ACAM 611]